MNLLAIIVFEQNTPSIEKLKILLFTNMYLISISLTMIDKRFWLMSLTLTFSYL